MTDIADARPTDATSIIEFDHERSGDPIELTIIVPTRNEVDNVTTMFSRVNAAFADIQAEILIVDDSDDSTPFLVAEQAQTSALPVRLLHREPGRARGGLALRRRRRRPARPRRVGPRHGRRPAAPAGGRRRASPRTARARR